MREQESNNVRPIESLTKFLDSIGRSRTTGYRWRQKGWLKCVTISGRPYVTAAAVAEFMKHVEAGDFSGGEN